MGLDMYLFPKRKGESVEKIVEEFDYAAYWRKNYDLDHLFLHNGIPTKEPDQYIIKRQLLIDLLDQRIKDYIALPLDDDWYDYESSVKKDEIDQLLKVLHENKEDKFIYVASR